MNDRTKATLLAVLLMTVLGQARAHHEPDPGMYYDPAFNGHGLDLHRAGEIWFVLFYTYGSDGSPIWYLAAAPMENGVLAADLLRFRYEPGSTPPQQVDAVVGTVSLDFSNLTKGACHAFDWTIDGESGSWCVQRLIASEGEPVAGSNWSGNWFAGASDEGWGLSVHFQGAEDLLEFLLIYFYDAAGFPRWGLGVNGQAGPVAEVSMDQFSGYCRTCTPIGLTTQPMGTVSHALGLDAKAPTAVFNVDVTYQGSPGGHWERVDTAGELASNFAPGLVPFPDAIDNDTPVAIEDVTVVPMEGEKSLLHHQTVVIENGEIASVSYRGEADIPANAVRVDGREHFLGPGLSEMHLHISFGGQTAAEEAGLLMIANGVTAALNMGDNFSIDVPALDERFASGELIGPTFYTGQVAYGTSDNSGPSNTVANPSAATSFSSQIAAAGYDYIKVYWGITPDTMDRFAIESQNLGLPIIGHLPQTQGIQANFQDGHIMAAHVQEPWINFLNRQFNDAQLPAAAAFFLQFGVYLTPTLAVFESWTSIYGGDTDTFNELVAREGVQYTPANIRTAWLNYFNSTAVQGNGQVDGGLDPMMEFFYRLTKAFHDEGVPLLVGTDAPGFPGVMSGFGAHREMELFEIAGIKPPDIYRAASTNAGMFVADTLGGTPFGTVATGNRADLILTDDNPLAALVNLQRPAGVISRGRFWSQTFLQEKLNELLDKHDQDRDKYPPLGLPFCADHVIAPQ